MIRTAFIVSMLFFIGSSVSAQKTEILYVGTFFGKGSEGIYVYEFNRAKGKLKLIQVVPTLESPSFLAVHPTGKFLYSVNRGAVEEMKSSGSVSAFSIDSKTGKLTLLNQRPSYGSDPCHIIIDNTGKWAIVSNYGDGNFVVLSIFDDGLLGSSSDSRKHVGSSINKDRQTEPHVHSATLSYDNRFLLVADLGTDKIYSYAFNASEGRISPAEKPFADVKPGTGPRHLTFHPNGKFVYVAEELTSTVGTFSYNTKTGALKTLQDSLKSLPDSFNGTSYSADIHTDPKGKFLYASNRGHNSLSVFSIDAAGKLKLAGHQDTKGKIPRNFMVDKRGQYVFAANQETGNVVLFKLDQKSGKLIDIDYQISVPSPVCLVLFPLK